MRKFVFVSLLTILFLYFSSGFQEIFFLAKFYVGFFALLSFYFLMTIFKQGSPMTPGYNPFRMFLFYGYLYLFFFCVRNGANFYIQRESMMELGFFLALVLFFIDFFSQKDSERFFSIAVSFMAAAVSLYGILQYCGIDLYSMARGFSFWKQYEEKRRIFSTVGNPNLLAGLLLFTIPVCDEVYRNSRKKSARLLSGAGIILMIVCFLMTKSYGAFLVLSLYVSGIFLRKFWTVKKPLCILFLSSAVIILFLLAASTPGKKICSKIGGKLKIRSYIWDVSLMIVKDRPLTGHGPGMFKKIFQQYMLKYNVENLDTLNRAIPREFVYAHNELLHAIIEWGIIGVVLFLFLLAGLMHVKDFFRFPGVPVVMVTAHSFLSPVFHTPPIYFLIAASLGMMFIQKKNTVIQPVVPKKWLDYLFLSTIIFFLMYFSNYLSTRMFENEGYFHYQRREYPQALSKYRECLELNRDFGPGLLHLGMIDLVYGRYENSLKKLEKADYYCSDIKIFISRSTACYHLKDYENAVKYMEKARDHYFVEYYYEINNNLGNIFFEMGNYADALKHFLIAYRNPGEHYETITYNLGLTYEKLGLIEKALEFYEDLFRLKGLKNSGDFLLKLARHRARTGRYSESRKLYEHLLKTIPNNFPLMLELADMLYEQGNKADAYIYYISVKSMATDPVLKEKANNKLLLIKVK